MNYYQAQYYNEALLHFGVKGMKWGVRKKRIASAVKKSAKTYGNFQKERLKTLGNSYIHPIMTSRALSNNMKNDKLSTKLRKSLYLTGNEYKSINRDVRRQKLAKRKQKLAKNPVRYGKEYGKAWINARVHPVRTMAAHGGLNRNARMKTLLRRSLGIYSGKELEAINKDVRNQGRNMKRIKSQPKTKTKLAKPQPIRRAYETARLGGNSVIHPIRTGIAVAESNRNKRMKTILRRQLALSTNEMRALSDDVRYQNTVARRRKAERKMMKKMRKKKR